MGLDSAGKTTILYKMKLQEFSDTTPTIGFNLEEIKIKNVTIKVWDLSGQEKMRSVWKHYQEAVQGIIFVIDSANRERLSEARDELHKVFSQSKQLNCPVLVFANKQDCPEALSYPELREELAICGDVSSRGSRVHLLLCSAKEGKGLQEGFQWIVDEIANPQVVKKAAK